MWSSLRRRAATLLGREAAKQEPAKATAKQIQQTHQPQSQPQPSVEMEDALRRSALRGTTAARAAANGALERASASLKSTVGEARVGLDKTTNLLQDQANVLQRSASDTVQRSAKDLRSKLSSQAAAAGEQVYRQAQSTKESMAARASDAATSATSAAPRMAASATRVASENLQGAAGALINEARETRDRTFKWIWWWSLAAVGIYGFASSLPRELIRHYAATREDSNASGEPSASVLEERNARSTSNGESQHEERPASSNKSASGGDYWKRAADKLFRRRGGDIDNN
mmetsp:Transcript_33447/g.98588  ORF Transcript_33447/g.98588 Transcript_33447/m.98588 type:complete len:288 (+) Transcript_33447:72-935(+)